MQEVIAVAETRESEAFLQHLRRHEQRQTTYLEMFLGLAQSGIEKWAVDTGRMTMTFYDKPGREMLVEQVSEVQWSWIVGETSLLLSKLPNDWVTWPEAGNPQRKMFAVVTGSR